MRFYRLLLHLYPISFRGEYGGEMSAVYAARVRQTSRGLPMLALWIATAADVISNALAAHWDVLRHDLRYTFRTLVRSPGFALTAILVTALGIGANTAAFSVADFVLIRRLPFADPDRIVKLWEHPPGYGRFEVSPMNGPAPTAACCSVTDSGSRTSAARPRCSGDRSYSTARHAWSSA